MLGQLPGSGYSIRTAVSRRPLLTSFRILCPESPRSIISESPIFNIVCFIQIQRIKLSSESISVSHDILKQVQDVSKSFCSPGLSPLYPLLCSLNLNLSLFFSLLRPMPYVFCSFSSASTSTSASASAFPPFPGFTIP